MARGHHKSCKGLHFKYIKEEIYGNAELAYRAGDYNKQHYCGA
jgi:hypothetical protein